MPGPENFFRRQFRRAVPVATALSLIVLAAPTGCRGLSPRKEIAPPISTEAPRFSDGFSDGFSKSASTTTAYKPPVFSGESVTSSSASAFRPIVPEHLQSSPVREAAPLPAAQPTVLSADVPNAKVDELTRRVNELEKALAESEANALEARKAAEKTPTSPVSTEASSTEVSKPVVSEPPAPPPRKVPILNAPGVTVTSEGDRIRFGVTDAAVFVPGTTRITPEAEETFRKIAAEIRVMDPNASLEIEGHTDSLNTDPAHPMRKHEISATKAVVVMEYFVKSLLWDHEKIRTGAYGAGRPAADNGTPEGRAKNNRIEIVVIPN